MCAALSSLDLSGNRFTFAGSAALTAHLTARLRSGACALQQVELGLGHAGAPAGSSGPGAAPNVHESDSAEWRQAIAALEEALRANRAASRAKHAAGATTSTKSGICFGTKKT